ncbi:uncharacterized protein METZ01_LOCUS408840 [marine metagenome]|uniref:Uncharacterized protein n=1 Tax=marine metagenome TaxID=408172 RepID=A0A382WAV0_9ZZZZ
MVALGKGDVIVRKPTEKSNGVVNHQPNQAPIAAQRKNPTSGTMILGFTLITIFRSSSFLLSCLLMSAKCYQIQLKRVN